MADNRQAQNNAVSHHSADSNNIEEAMRRLKIHDNQDGGAVPQSGPYPDRPGEPDCIYYLRTGLCGYGNNCRFNHPAHVVQGAQYGGELPERDGQPDCGFFLKTGTCKYGSTCKYHHPKDRHGAGPVTFNLIGLPMRQDEKSCPYYMRTGACKFGVACKFHHPQPAPVGSPSAAAYGSGSSNVPSSALPYVGGIPTWSGPRAPYMPTPRVPLPPSYMPIVLSPTQGLISAQGWNTYVGNMGPLSPSGILGSNLVYNSRNQGEFNSSRQMPLVLASSGSDLPERPDQPECRYFMNNGTCKYGSDCKYHHPKERITQFSTSTLGPLGLPLRPGQAVCSNYSMYGVCKYGPTCKFDHPFAGYPYNYSMGMPALSMIDTRVMKNSSLAHSSETSPSKSSKTSRKSDVVVKDKKTSEDAVEQATSPPNSWTTSEPPPDQSD